MPKRWRAGVCFIPHYLVGVRGMYTVQNPIDEDVVHNSRMTVEDVDSAVQLRKESGCYQSEILAGSDITVN